MPIRIAREQDLPQILAIYAPYVENTTVSFEYAPPSPEEFLKRYRQITGQFPWLVYEENDRVLGYAYASAPFSRDAYRWIAEPSIYLSPELRGQGIGRRLYTALERLLCLQGYLLSYAIITWENEASLAFHSRMGYSLLAKFPDCAYKHGRRLGIIWMQKQLNSAELPSNPPVTFPSLVQNNEKISEILDILSLS